MARLSSLVCLLLLFISTARAQGVSPARELFEEGVAARKRGDSQTACARFEESHALKPTASTLLNVAVCKRAKGDTRRAAEMFREVITRWPADAKKRAFAEEALRVMQTEADPSPLLDTRAADELRLGQRRRWRRAGLALAGVAAANLVVAAVSGGLAIANAHRYHEHCDAEGACDGTGIEAAKQGRWQAPLSTATLIIGLSAAAAGSFVLLLSPTSGHEPARAEARMRIAF
ncbi:MAG: hypothetical protein JWN04_6910 [Myxococcaceae bacterium]|nr:hypothetical protein [Myxococcaceae bacterium]